MAGHTNPNDYTLPLPFEYIEEDDLPESWYWGDINGTSYLTKSLNQHLPQVNKYMLHFALHVSGFVN